MSEGLEKFLTRWQVILVCRFILGGLFIYASFDKIIHPHEFAKVVYNFRILPDELIYIVALLLPWIELITGLLLVSGIFEKTAAFILSSLLLFFIVFLVINTIRGLDINCGCFSTSAESSNLVLDIIRDIGILIPGIIIILFASEAQRIKKSRAN